MLGRMAILLESEQFVSDDDGAVFWLKTGLTIQQSHCPVANFAGCKTASDFCNKCVKAASVIIGSGTLIIGRLQQIAEERVLIIIRRVKKKFGTNTPPDDDRTSTSLPQPAPPARPAPRPDGDRPLTPARRTAVEPDASVGVSGCARNSP